MGAFFSLMSASFQYEDPVLRAQGTLSNTQKTSAVFKEMGKNMWSSGKGFGKVGALFAGIECVIESVSSPTNTHYNPLKLCCFAQMCTQRRTNASECSIVPKTTLPTPSPPAFSQAASSPVTQARKPPLVVALHLPASQQLLTCSSSVVKHQSTSTSTPPTVHHASSLRCSGSSWVGQILTFSPTSTQLHFA